MQMLQAHVCSPCGEIRDEDEIADRRVTIALFGAVPANLCPSCLRDLSEDERVEVHARWRKQQGA